MLHEFLFHLSAIAHELWMPICIDSEADRCRFRFLTHAIAAIDSTPIRVMDPVGLQWLAGAIWTHKHHIPSFNLHLAVAPNGICLAILAILAGGRHDKRALDDTDAYLRFAYWQDSSAQFRSQCRRAVFPQEPLSDLFPVRLCIPLMSGWG